MIRLKDIAKGDLFPFHYFRLWEVVLVSNELIKREADLATKFTPGNLLYSARHEDNKTDINDHGTDDINGEIIFDGSGGKNLGLCHYEWLTGDTAKVGKYTGRLYGVIPGTPNRDVHLDTWFYFYITDKTRVGLKTS